MQVCTSLQTDNHASTPPLSFLQAGCPSCRPTNSVKALKAKKTLIQTTENHPMVFVHHYCSLYAGYPMPVPYCSTIIYYKQLNIANLAPN